MLVIYRQGSFLSVSCAAVSKIMTRTLLNTGYGMRKWFAIKYSNTVILPRYTWCNQEVGGSVYHLSTDEKDYDITKVGW